MSSDINGFSLISNTRVNISAVERGLALPLYDKWSLQRQMEEACRGTRNSDGKKCCLCGENSFSLSEGKYQIPVNNGNQEFWHRCTCLHRSLSCLAVIKKFMVGHEVLGNIQKRFYVRICSRNYEQAI